MSEEWTELDDAVEEVRAVRRRIWAEFDNDPHKYHEYLMEFQKQFADRLVSFAEGSESTQDPGGPDKSAA